MVENKKKIYFCDRWYYLVNETEDKLTYTTNQKNKMEGNLLEINKNSKQIQIIYLQKNKAVAKLEISNNDNNINLHYMEYECNEIEVNNEIYTNLLIELFATRKKHNYKGDFKIKFSKKKKLNKMCYRTPDFPIDNEIDLNSVKIDIKRIEEFKDLTTWLPNNIDKVLNNVFSSEQDIEKEEIKEIVRLEIPQELEIYDRVYNFIKQNDNKLIYENTEDDIINLEIKVDTINFVLQNVELITKAKNQTKNIKNSIQIFPNLENGITAKYVTSKKTNINLSGKIIEDAKIDSEVIFDKNYEKVSSNISIKAGKTQYDLIEHPYIKKNYVDNEGNIYHIGCSEFARFQGISSFASRIYKRIEKNIFKEKELIKEKK